jgi:hypothetical protein
VLLDPKPQAGLDFGSALAIAADASSIAVGAGGRVLLNAAAGGSDGAADGAVRPAGPRLNDATPAALIYKI